VIPLIAFITILTIGYEASVFAEFLDGRYKSKKQLFLALIPFYLVLGFLKDGLILLWDNIKYNWQQLNQWEKNDE